MRAVERRSARAPGRITPAGGLTVAVLQQGRRPVVPPRLVGAFPESEARLAGQRRDDTAEQRVGARPRLGTGELPEVDPGADAERGRGAVPRLDACQRSVRP